MTPTNGIDEVLHPSREKALAEWKRRVRANREQAERFREAQENPDFYMPIAGAFKVNPRRTNEAALDILLKMAEPGETWLDIGAGGGRYALPLALKVREVIAVEPSQAMLSTLRGSMTEYGIHNISLINNRWPIKDLPEANVALISHVGYDIEDIGPFLDSMESSARRLCVAVLLDAAPTSLANRFWPRIHGEPRVPLPALREFLVLQIARGCLCEVRLTTREPQSYPNLDMVHSFLRQQLFIASGGEKDQLLQQLLEGEVLERSGRFGFSWEPAPMGIVSWKPAR